jgi:hypothetical protein
LHARFHLSSFYLKFSLCQLALSLVPQDAGTVREALLLAACSNDARRIAVTPGIPTYAAVSYSDVCRRTRMRMLLTYSLVVEKEKMFDQSPAHVGSRAYFFRIRGYA